MNEDVAYFWGGVPEDQRLSPTPPLDFPPVKSANASQVSIT